MYVPTYIIEIATIPFPFIITLSANNEKSAISKAKYQVKRHGLKPGKTLRIEQLS
jgi:hypothetical protein